METAEQTTANKTVAENYFRRLGNRIKEGLRQLYRFFRPASGQTGSTTEQIKPEPLDAINKTLEDEFSHFQGHVELNGIEKDLMLSAKFMLAEGYTDGVNGIALKPRSEDIVTLASSRATRLYYLACSVIEGRLIKATRELKEKDELLIRYKDADNQEHKYFEVLQYYRRFHPRSCDIWWSILCFLFGIGLIVADLPLAFKLMEYGFDLNEKWEIYSIAGGISTCTVFIKIYYDNYIDLKYGNSFLIRNRFKKMFNSIDKDEGEEINMTDNEVMEHEVAAKKRWYNGILIFTIVGIVILGVFRTYAAQVIPSNAVMFKNMPIWIYLITFIFLTVVFPVIGGICFSAAFSGFLNIKLFKESKARCKLSTDRYIETLKANTELDKVVLDLTAERSKWQSDTTTKNYTAILLSYYDRGYKLGASRPEFNLYGNDLFKLAEQWRHKAMARKINNSIIKLSGL